MAAPVHITFLGGLGEIGRNCAVLELEGSLLLIDCGLMFPDTDMLGVDLVLPDFTWLIERADDIVKPRSRLLASGSAIATTRASGIRARLRMCSHPIIPVPMMP